jgi:ribosome modulation factor
MSDFHPAWEEGRQAYVDGDDESDCPYRKGTENYQHWIDGYESASNDDV